MTDPSTLKRDIMEMCKFTFCFTNSENVLAFMGSIFSRSSEGMCSELLTPKIMGTLLQLHFYPNKHMLNHILSTESLELWASPRRHLGGAGLHFPCPIESHVPLNWADKVPMGPWWCRNTETPVPISMTVDQIIEITGFVDECFDLNDVEKYLLSKVIQLGE